MTDPAHFTTNDGVKFVEITKERYFDLLDLGCAVGWTSLDPEKCSWQFLERDSPRAGHYPAKYYARIDSDG